MEKKKKNEKNRKIFKTKRIRERKTNNNRRAGRILRVPDSRFADTAPAEHPDDIARFLKYKKQKKNSRVLRYRTHYIAKTYGAFSFFWVFFCLVGVPEQSAAAGRRRRC